MTVPEKLKFILMKDYYIEYTKDNELIIRNKINVKELLRIRKCLNKWGVNYTNIIVK